MTTLARMGKDQSHMNERVLNLTLKIIYLLTGEDYVIVNKLSGKPLTPNICLHGTSPITAPPPHCLTTEVTNAKKILDLTMKMMELLTGEVPIRCQDVTVYFSMEEWEYLEGHKDLYKDVIMENQPPLTSPDGSSNGNPPERCPRPLYSRDSTQEGHTIPHHHQGEEMKDIKVEVKEEEEEEKRLVSREQQSMEEGEMIMKSEQKELSLHMDTSVNYARDRSPLILSPDYKAEDNGTTQHSLEVNPINQYIHHLPYHLQTSMDPSNPEKSSDESQTISQSVEKSADTSNPKESPLHHTNVHSGDGPFTFSECGKWFTQQGNPFNMNNQMVGHLYSCAVCGKGFILKSELARHKKIHTVERPYPCPVCGKCFIEKYTLLQHQKIHTGERPYTCTACGKSFTHKADLVRHQKIHTGERPFLCSECGKCFIEKGKLVIHQRRHTGELPYSCPECGKCFAKKGKLIIHQRLHTGERPYSCLECGKGFAEKGKLIIHQRLHTGERPYSCPECGKCFAEKSNLLKHQGTHNRKESLSCSECGKCFKYKGNLIIHQSTHTG